jgi:hypothetical protein
MDVEFKLSRKELQDTTINVSKRGCEECLIVITNKGEKFPSYTPLSLQDAINLKNALDCIIKTMEL